VRNQAEHNTFIFNNEIDRDLLFSLYEDDFPYIEEIFSITLSQIKPDISQLLTAFEAGNTQELRRATHKLKPSFGFVGLPAMQEQCRQFESECSVATSVDSLTPSFRKLVAGLDASVILLESEYQKLKEFNQP